MKPEELEKRAKSHEAFLFAQKHSAEKQPFFFIMDCPECHQHKLYFDEESFICWSCGKKGNFEELKKLVNDQSNESQDSQNLV